ncbi:MAG: discoidin domain-containing protein [Phycisphaerae bacterium]|nr:discoidin domain-containing protein [Phycisphaerae bacterium]
MMKVKNSVLLLACLLGLSNCASAVLLIGGDILNGNFNSLVSESTVDAQPYDNVVGWYNIAPSGNQTTQATRANLGFDGSRNAVLAGGTHRYSAMDTGHTISAGESFDVGYVWRDASGWDDAVDEVVVILFVTDDNTITGTRTDLVQDLSGLSTQDSTYEEVDHDGIYEATAADAGKILFVMFAANTTTTSRFARLDNFTLEVSVTFGASDPNPQNGAEDVLVDADLSWEPGMSAKTHDIYFGTAFEDVNDAAVPTIAGLDVNSFDPGRLEFGQTYFWRVDAVSGTPDKTVTKGAVWSFTAEPYSVMIPVGIDHVTASSATAANPPSLVVNGSGLDGSTHSTDSDTMWLSDTPELDPWLMFEFDSLQKLDHMVIWNSNGASERFVGWGIKKVNIEFSVDGVAWTGLAESTEISQAPGLDTYSEPQVVNLGLALAKYVRLNILSNWGGLLNQYGVAEVQFYGLPMYARTPDPVSGSTVLPSAVATWRAGREAAEHAVYTGTDAQALTSSVSSNSNSIDLSSLDLQLDQTYYWRVDEVNEAEAVSVWQGPVWTLSIVPFLTVDDFDRYDNFSPNRPFQTWLDGFGYSADEFFPVDYPGNGTGSGVGHDIWGPGSPHFDGTIMESTLAKSGKSMPLYFNNTGGISVSEAVRTFESAQNWAAYGIKSLSLDIYGDPGNSGQLYLKINGTRINYSGLSDALQRQQWIPWHIDLSGVSGLQAVTSLTLGIEGAGATGVVYVDDIRLYALTPETIDPVVPSDSDPNLVAFYAFEGNANDSAGDHHATSEGAPLYTAGKVGQAISLDGLFDYVVYPFDAEETWSATSVCLWAQAGMLAQPVWSGLFNNNAADNDFQFDVDGTDPGFYRYNGTGGSGLFGIVTNEWVHLAMSCDGSQTRIYYNGLYVTSISAANTQFGQIAVGVNRGMATVFNGAIDDVRLYNRALSDGEVAGLAGLAEAIPSSF